MRGVRGDESASSTDPHEPARSSRDHGVAEFAVDVLATVDGVELNPAARGEVGDDAMGSSQDDSWICMHAHACCIHSLGGGVYRVREGPGCGWVQLGTAWVTVGAPH